MKSLGMGMTFGYPIWLRTALTIAVGLWLGLGPLMAASDLWRAAPDCCCGRGSVCLLGGCDCGARERHDSSPCGGMRASEDAGHQASILVFGLQLGLIGSEHSTTVRATGEIRAVEATVSGPYVPALEPPPPRSASAR